MHGYDLMRNTQGQQWHHILQGCFRFSPNCLWNTEHRVHDTDHAKKPPTPNLCGDFPEKLILLPSRMVCSAWPIAVMMHCQRLTALAMQDKYQANYKINQTREKE